MSKLKVLKFKGQLKREIHLIQTLNLMRQIAAAEFHHLEGERNKAGEFILLLDAFFNFYESANIHPENDSAETQGSSCIVAITSNEGFLGALNNEVITKTTELYEKDPDSSIVIIGARGARRLSEMGLSAVEFPGIPFPLEASATLPLHSYLMGKYSSKEFNSVRIVYPRCYSMARQTIVASEILPFNILDLARKSKKNNSWRDEIGYVLVEPSAQRIIEYTISLCFQRQLYEIFWNAKLSEVAARTIELNQRYERLSKDIQKMKTQYFRACHDVIDEGIREISASIRFSKLLEKEA